MRQSLRRHHKPPLCSWPTTGSSVSVVPLQKSEKREAVARRNQTLGQFDHSPERNPIQRRSASLRLSSCYFTQSRAAGSRLRDRLVRVESSSQVSKYTWL